jgi:hypothetical protein
MSFDDDIRRINDILMNRFHIMQSESDLIEEFWRSHSRKFSAGWLVLPQEDEEIIKAFLDQLHSPAYHILWPQAHGSI